MLPDLNNIPKDKRDWLEIYGNQYRAKAVAPGTCEACVFARGEHVPGCKWDFGLVMNEAWKDLAKAHVDLRQSIRGLMNKPAAKVMPGTCERCIWNSGEHSQECLWELADKLAGEANLLIAENYRTALEGIGIKL